MNGRYMQLPSQAMGRPIHLWAYGYFGLPVIVFPSAAGFAHEWQAQGMIEVLKPLLAAGKIKLYCPESNVAEAWTRHERPLEERMQKHVAYEKFISEELMSFIRKDCNWANPTVTVTGCSLGAMYAANFALKFPELFNQAICMSGRYLATELTKGQHSLDVYFNSPIAYVSNLNGHALERVKKHTKIILVCGRGAYEEGCIEETISLGRILQRKQIPNYIDIWGTESRHDWGWWKQQALKHFRQQFV
ncbi:MAG: alpha/beta hydrolase-fold protein [Myxococcota bacterium]|nr:alpha/beta hydrolase-fold protein [Myxococcota bacterium]